MNLKFWQRKKKPEFKINLVTAKIGFTPCFMPKIELTGDKKVDSLITAAFYCLIIDKLIKKKRRRRR